MGELLSECFGKKEREGFGKRQINEEGRAGGDSFSLNENFKLVIYAPLQGKEVAGHFSERPFSRAKKALIVESIVEEPHGGIALSSIIGCPLFDFERSDRGALDFQNQFMLFPAEIGNPEKRRKGALHDERGVFFFELHLESEVVDVFAVETALGRFEEMIKVGAPLSTYALF